MDLRPLRDRTLVVVEGLLVYKITFMDEEIKEPSEETLDEDIEEDEEDEGENEE